MARQSKLQEELQQTKPFRSLAHEAGLSILKTADVLRRRTAAVLSPYGITPQQYNVLRILRGAGVQGMPTLDIVDRLIEETPGITRMLDRLEARGWVRRERCATDRRQVFACIRPAGLELLATLDPVMDASGLAPISGLGERETSALVRTLERIRMHAEE